MHHNERVDIVTLAPPPWHRRCVQPFADACCLPLQWKEPSTAMPARVAVLDDDEATRELLGSVLELEQYQALLLQTPRGALEALAAYASDLIILDLFFGHAPLAGICLLVSARIRYERSIPGR